VPEVLGGDMTRTTVYALVAAGIGVAIGTAAARNPQVRAALEVARLPTPRPFPTDTDDDRHTPEDTIRYLTEHQTGAHP
jgi:hypothetical protein